MHHILWVTNKYVEGGSLSRFYPDFLMNVEKNIKKEGHKISFVFFTDAMRAKVKTKNNFFFERKKINIRNLEQKAQKIENDYQFTFKQAYFPDLIQVSKRQDYRKIHLSEKEFHNLNHLIPRFIYLERIIERDKIDIVFCDQSSEAEMEFARAICLKKNKIFLRQSDSFLGRCLFYQQFAFGKERIVQPILDKKMTRNIAKNYVLDFVKNNRLPYLPKQCVAPNFAEFYLPRLLHFYRYPQYIKIALSKPWLLFEEKILKATLRNKFDPRKPYLFFGLHSPIESTIALRALPYMTQVSLIESISRVMPHGYYLYVREHPAWRERFPFLYIKTLKALPSVRLISADIPIAKILKHAQGVLTYNSTTGIEALMYGKPVLSFAPNSYYKLHPAADYCSDLYDLGMKLAKLIKTPVDKNDTYKYIYEMFRSSSEISIQAGTFLSSDDSASKALIFTSELLAAIEFCLKKS